MPQICQGTDTVSQLTHTTTTKQKHGGYPVEGYEAGDDCNQRDSVLLIIFRCPSTICLIHQEKKYSVLTKSRL